MGLVKQVQQVRTAVGPQDTLKRDPVRIHLKEGEVPFAVHTARRALPPLLPKVQKELQRMEEHCVIEKIMQPTDWCAPIVPGMKTTGAAMICVGLQKLNQNLRRARYQMLTTDEILAKLSGSTVFTSLDAASGLWQIPLHEDSNISPFRRYFFKHLPFGINIAPEIFQRKMNKLLEGLEDVAVYMDDVIAHGKDNGYT